MAEVPTEVPTGATGGVPHRTIEEPKQVYWACPKCEHICIDSYERMVAVMGRDESEKKVVLQWTIDTSFPPLLDTDEVWVTEYELPNAKMTFAQLKLLADVIEADYRFGSPPAQSVQ